MTKTLLRVLSGEAVSPPPIWLMRQAGRYLPEYRKVREQAGSFLDLCYSPELAEEVTLQPIRRFGFDAAILFADILLIPHALGQELTFVAGEGPRLEPIGDAQALGALGPADAIDETLAPVYQTVSRLKHSLPADTTLIGFAGAPWTVATYMVAGQGTADQAPARRWSYEDPDGFEALIERVTDATIHYLGRQIEAGAEVVMLFDTWAGALAPGPFRRFVIEPTQRIVRTLKAGHPGVPVIGFPRGAAAMAGVYSERTGINALAADTATPLEWLDGQVPPRVALQGNLDPMLLVTGGEALTETARRLVGDMEGRPYIFNLGHGITPDADPDHVEALVAAVRG